MIHYRDIDTPLGTMRLTARGQRFTGAHFIGEKHFPALAPDWQRDDLHATLRQASQQLSEYFAGERKQFALPLAPEGTPFQQQVWTALLSIPYGETISYLELARRVGNAKAMRAVGAANGRNPISIVVPCHRVIGADGSLTGYAGGLERKRALLGLEMGAGELFETASQRLYSAKDVPVT